MSAFERLPSEILLKIMDLIDRLHDSKRDGGRNTKDLANLRLTCRRLANAAAEALFYRVSQSRSSSRSACILGCVDGLWMSRWRITCRSHDPHSTIATLPTSSIGRYPGVDIGAFR